MSYREVLDAALAELDATGIAISRLASPRLRDAVSSRDVLTVPAVRGRAVWAAAAGRASIVENPSWLGPAEAAPSGPFLCVTNPGSRPPWDGGPMLVTAGETLETVGPDWQPAAEAHASFAARTDQARRVAGHLRQAPGVSVAWPVAAPVTLLLFPTSPGEILADHPPPEGSHATPVHGLPEFPGGVRVEIGSPIEDTVLRAWAAAVAAAITSRE